jgi:hypothetical protein
MTDLVERLRNPPIRIKHGGYAEASGVELDQFEVLVLLAKSADEIEHLRKALNGLYDAYMELTYDSPVSGDAAILEKTRTALSRGK